MNPTSPQPPGLSDEQRAKFALDYPDSREDSHDFDRLCDAVFAAGCEAQRRVDAEIARTEVPGDMCGDLIAAAIESSSGERAETQPAEHCPQCESPERGYTPYPCDNVPYARRHPWHSQPTTGEASHVHEDGKDCGRKDA